MLQYVFVYYIYIHIYVHKLRFKCSANAGALFFSPPFRLELGLSCKCWIARHRPTSIAKVSAKRRPETRSSSFSQNIMKG